mgnify:CR=1 FL=1
MSNLDVDRNAAIAASGWGERYRFVQVHNATFWLYAVLLAIGILHFNDQLTDAVSRVPTAAVTASVLWAIWLIPWVWFLQSRDRFGRQTFRVAATGFFWGGLIATFVIAIPANAAMLSLLGKIFGDGAGLSWAAAFTAPFVEETAKGLGIVVVVLLARAHVRNSYDGFVIGAFVGLGFQVFEDWVYTVQAAEAAFGANQVQTTLALFGARGGYVALASHAAYSALVGAGIGWWIQNRGRGLGVQLPRAALLIGLAFFIHGLWDFLAFQGLKTVAPLMVVIVVALVVVVGRWTQRQERPWMHDLLAPELASGLITDDELDALVGTPHDRRKLAHEMGGEHGRAGRKAAKHVLHAEMDLAEALAESHGTESDDVAHARSELQRLRSDYAALVDA